MNSSNIYYKINGTDLIISLNFHYIGSHKDSNLVNEIKKFFKNIYLKCPYLRKEFIHESIPSFHVDLNIIIAPFLFITLGLQ